MKIIYLITIWNIQNVITFVHIWRIDSWEQESYKNIGWGLFIISYKQLKKSEIALFLSRFINFHTNNFFTFSKICHKYINMLYIQSLYYYKDIYNFWTTFEYQKTNLTNKKRINQWSRNLSFLFIPLTSIK